MANKKIQLIYLWADEHVMLDDFGAKISKGMTDWANEFYRPYGFELDVQPAPNVGTVALAHKFALQKNDGITPDMDWAKRVEEDFAPRFAAIEKQIEARKKEENDFENALAAQSAIVAAREAELAQVPAGDTNGQIAALQRFTAALNAQTAASKRLRAASKRVRELLEEKGTLLTRQEMIQAQYETELRLQIADKFLFDKIGDGKRLSIVFCRFIQSARDKPKVVLGRAYLQLTQKIVFAPGGIPRWVWPYPFIIIDIKTADPNTVAHEIVHAAGQNHPDAQTVVKDLEKVLKFRRSTRSLLDMAISWYEYMSLFEVMPGGYFDGAANDIMNYSATGKEPSDFILSDSDRLLLERAPFVK